jgi:hypothetical protein
MLSVLKRALKNESTYDKLCLSLGYNGEFSVGAKHLLL